MRPPALAQALIAAVAPSNEYEIVAGDLHEDYLRIRSACGAKAANRWYWAQTLLSIPSLLSYSRSNGSALRRISVSLVAFAVLVAMLVAVSAIDAVVRSMFGPTPLPRYVGFCIAYATTVSFGAILARLVRTDALRVTFLASLFLVSCFVIPALAGNPHSQAPLVAWIQLLGAIPTMCAGAGLYQAVSRGAGSVH